MKLSLLGAMALVMGSSAFTHELKSFELSHLNEIFLKGSSNGENLVMVLGVEEGQAKAAAHAEKIVDLADWETIGKMVYNSQHDGDILDAVRSSADFFSEKAPTILSAPWESLKKIPGAFKAQINEGRDAYFDSESAMEGVAKYSAYAVWATFKGSYYLILEAPAQLIARSLWTGAGTAMHLASHGLKLTWKISSEVAQGLYHSVLAAATYSYSVASSTVATALELTSMGFVFAYTSARWVAYEAPLNLFRYSVVESEFDEDVSAEDAGVLVESYVTQSLANYPTLFQGNLRVTSELGENYSKVVVRSKSSESILESKALKVTVRRKAFSKKVVLRVEMPRRYARFLRKHSSQLSSLSRADARVAIEAELAKFNSDLVSLIKSSNSEE